MSTERPEGESSIHESVRTLVGDVYNADELNRCIAALGEDRVRSIIEDGASKMALEDRRPGDVEPNARPWSENDANTYMQEVWNGMLAEAKEQQ